MEPPVYRILIVEDHPDVAGLMRMMVGVLGHKAEVSGSVAGALERASRESFDLFLVDYRLPDGNGTDLVKALSAGGSVKAVLLTAYDPSELTPTETEGLSACLRKPVDMQELRRTIETLCS